MGITAAAQSKRYVLLLIVVATFSLALVALYFHADHDLAPSNRKTDEITKR